MAFSERAGWGNPRLDLAAPPSRGRRLAAAFAQGPLRDTALITLGGLLVTVGYVLGLAVPR